MINNEGFTIRKLREILNSISDEDIDYDNDEGQVWIASSNNLSNQMTSVWRLNKNDIILE
jgi:hypothetical protein